MSVAISLLAPGAHAADPQTLNIWANDEQKSITIDMANEFAKLHPEIKVQIRRVGFAALNDETMRAAMSGNGPDIVTIDNPNVAMFAGARRPGRSLAVSREIQGDRRKADL